MKTNMMKWMAVLFAVVVCAVGLTGCAGSSDDSEFIPQGEYEEVPEEDGYPEEWDYEDDYDEDIYPEDQLIEDEGVSDEALSKESPVQEQPANPKVSADYLDAVKGQYPDYVDASKTMNVNGQDYETVVLFHTDGDVEDFRVFSMELNIDENGKADLIPKEVFRAAELRRDAPIAVPLDFPGDMSLNGFCYKGADGSFKTFTVGMSGEDGSLVINSENFEVQ